MPDFIAVDIETSGLDPRRHEILSIGMVQYHTGKSISLDVLHRDLVVSPGAFRVNQIDVCQLDNGTTRMWPSDVEKELNNFLRSNTDEPIAMGVNVGSFDMKFIEAKFLSVYKRFGYRSMDLTSLTFLLAHTQHITAKEARSMLYESANQGVRLMQDDGLLPSDMTQHNALYDVYLNCIMFAEVTRLLTSVDEAPDWLRRYV